MKLEKTGETPWPGEPPQAPPPGSEEIDRPKDGRDDEKIFVPIVR